MKNYLVRTTSTKKTLGEFDTYAEAEAFANELAAPTIIEDNFTGTSELWFNNEMTDSVPFAGGAETVAMILQVAKEDYADVRKFLAPGCELAPQSITIWFD